jgi:ribosomal protein L21E
MPRYDKALIEEEAFKSVEQGYLTEELGAFILQRAIEISGSAFVTDGNKELKQALIDSAVMRTCEKFLHYYQSGKSAANLIISIIYSTMTNKIVSLNHSDVYGHNIKGYVVSIKDGEKKIRLVRYTKDNYLSEKL